MLQKIKYGQYIRVTNKFHIVLVVYIFSLSLSLSLSHTHTHTHIRSFTYGNTYTPLMSVFHLFQPYVMSYTSHPHFNISDHNKTKTILLPAFDSIHRILYNTENTNMINSVIIIAMLYCLSTCFTVATGIKLWLDALSYAVFHSHIWNRLKQIWFQILVSLAGIFLSVIQFPMAFESLFKMCRVLVEQYLLISTSTRRIYFRCCPLVLHSFCVIAGKNYQTDFHETQWRGVAWANLEPMTFWSGSESQGRSTIFFSLSINIVSVVTGVIYNTSNHQRVEESTLPSAILVSLVWNTQPYMSVQRCSSAYHCCNVWWFA